MSYEPFWKDRKINPNLIGEHFGFDNSQICEWVGRLRGRDGRYRGNYYQPKSAQRSLDQGFPGARNFTSYLEEKLGECPTLKGPVVDKVSQRDWEVWFKDKQIGIYRVAGKLSNLINGGEFVRVYIGEIPGMKDWYDKNEFVLIYNRKFEGQNRGLKVSWCRLDPNRHIPFP